jgi:hypothetical protein
MAIKIKNNTVIYDDEVLRVSANTTATRPGSPEIGMIRFNTDESSFEGYDGTQWKSIGADEVTKTIALLGY